MTDKSFGILLAVTAGMLWSTIGLSIKSIDQANVFQILFYRSIFISIFIGLLLHFFFRFNFLNLLKNWVSYFAGGTALFFAYIGGIYALLTTSAANALLLFACAPIFTAILSPILLRETISLRTIMAILIAFLGVLIMVWSDFGARGLERKLVSCYFSHRFLILYYKFESKQTPANAALCIFVWDHFVPSLLS
ncbi:MAG: DMT family transporter [Paracoccaceae bacterium]